MRNHRRPVTILIDATDIDRPSGVRTAVLELFRVLFALETGWRFIILVSQFEPDFDFPHVEQRRIPVRNRVLERLWVQSVVLATTLTRRVDLVHFARSLGGFTGPARNVLTIFDVTTLRYPQLHARSAVWFWRHIQPQFLHAADRVITISQDVKDDLVQDFGIPPEKMTVVYCAPKAVFRERIVTEDERRALREKYNLPDPYLLFVGMVAKKKNLHTLIQALHILKERSGPRLALVIAGRRYRQSDDEAIFDLIHDLDLEDDVHYIGPAPDDELPALYRNAAVFVYPSLHEGFGIPCVEAMVCEVPLIASRSGAIPEVVGEAGVLIDDPLKPEQFADAIAQVLTNPRLRETLLVKGKARATVFDWQQLAHQVLTIYRRTLEDAG